MQLHLLLWLYGIFVNFLAPKRTELKKEIGELFYSTCLSIWIMRFLGSVLEHHSHWRPGRLGPGLRSWSVSRFGLPAQYESLLLAYCMVSVSLAVNVCSVVNAGFEVPVMNRPTVTIQS